MKSPIKMDNVKSLPPLKPYGCGAGKWGFPANGHVEHDVTGKHQTEHLMILDWQWPKSCMAIEKSLRRMGVVIGTPVSNVLKPFRNWNDHVDWVTEVKWSLSFWDRLHGRTSPIPNIIVKQWWWCFDCFGPPSKLQRHQQQQHFPLKSLSPGPKKQRCFTSPARSSFEDLQSNPGSLDSPVRRREILVEVSWNKPQNGWFLD